jgi:hypothetical protein
VERAALKGQVPVIGVVPAGWGGREASAHEGRLQHRVPCRGGGGRSVPAPALPHGPKCSWSPRAELQKELRIWAVSSIPILQNQHFFGILLTITTSACLFTIECRL